MLEIHGEPIEGKPISKEVKSRKIKKRRTFGPGNCEINN
jgi:hypothetical protein